MSKSGFKDRSAGFSLAELVVALTISSMVMITLLTVYQRAQSSAIAAGHQMERGAILNEVLQRIAEDIDDIVDEQFDATIRIENRMHDGYQSSRLEIENKIFNSDGQEEVFRRIVWQSYPNYETPAGGLIVYRSHSGFAPEDKLLQRGRTQRELERFIPVCEGVTYFQVRARHGEQKLDRWQADELPRGLQISLSFSEPVQSGTELLVPEEDIASRTVAVDRTRKIEFDFMQLDIDDEQLEAEPNEAADPNELNDDDRSMIE